jgi:NAD+ kinase
MLALTPISPFRPRRWSGAILPDDTAVCFRILEAENRPVSAVADQIEVRVRALQPGRAALNVTGIVYGP